MIPKSMILTTFPGDAFPGSSSTNSFEWSVTLDSVVPALSSVNDRNWLDGIEEPFCSLPSDLRAS